jgi:Mrp family chromosome partitioning ATPase
MPTGDPAGIPIEILGTLELRQLIKAVSGHYHRVILDGPAVLGMADCRMLGRVVDATILVVRSEAHGLSPLRRAKAMLDQSRVPLAGVVFNGLADDFENWSSYGSGASFDVMPSRRGLEAPDEESAAMAAGEGQEA